MKQFITLFLLSFLSISAFSQNKVAVFDMDGTLISESPRYAMHDFIIEMTDIEVNTYEELEQAVIFIGSQSNYKELVSKFLQKDMIKIYQPMYDTLLRLKREGYDLVLCTGSEMEFAQQLADLYFNGIFNEVIGATVTGEIDWNDEEGKVVNLQKRGISPDIVYGNSTGDYAMLSIAQKGYLVIHDDKERNEYDKPEMYLEYCKKNGIEPILISEWRKVN